MNSNFGGDALGGASNNSLSSNNYSGLGTAGIAVIAITMAAAIVISEERDLIQQFKLQLVLAATIGIQIVLARMQVVTQQAVTHVLLVMAQANRLVLCS